jgi:hypothetical protein
MMIPLNIIPALYSHSTGELLSIRYRHAPKFRDGQYILTLGSDTGIELSVNPE